MLEFLFVLFNLILILFYKEDIISIVQLRKQT
jgi:hypothetical protein